MNDHRAYTGTINVGPMSPFVNIPRAKWKELAGSFEQPLTTSEISSLQGLGDTLNAREVSEVYLPVSRLLNMYATGIRKLHDTTAEFLREKHNGTPFVIGIAGSVAVGKSTIARLLRELLSRWEGTPRVELVTTDGFLYPNAELERRGIMLRKGFPESYDQRSLLRFVTAVKSGVEEVRAPFYSHLAYDIMPDAEVIVNQPDILIVEGLNVLQPSIGSSALAVSDLFDFSIYVDAKEETIQDWYVNRFMKLKDGAFADPNSYFHRYADLSDELAKQTAFEIWKNINHPNLVENILPTRARAKLVLRKDADHQVRNVQLRKL